MRSMRGQDSISTHCRGSPLPGSKACARAQRCALECFHGGWQTVLLPSVKLLPRYGSGPGPSTDRSNHCFQIRFHPSRRLVAVFVPATARTKVLPPDSSSRDTDMRLVLCSTSTRPKACRDGKTTGQCRDIPRHECQGRATTGKSMCIARHSKRSAAQGPEEKLLDDR